MVTSPTAPVLKFERKRAITLSIYSWKARTVGYFKCMDRIVAGHVIEEKKAEAGKGKTEQKKPADLMRIIDLETGAQADMIVPTVLKSNLEEKVKDYVGHCFEARSTQREGKSYKDFELYEINDPAGK